MLRNSFVANGSRPPGKALGALLALALGMMASGPAAADCHQGASADHRADHHPRFVERFAFPGARTVGVVAEGECEPASIGSYSLRIYSGISPNFPTDEFVTGVVRSRDGGVTGVAFHDVDGDGKDDIVVTIKGAGSGGFLTGDAFRYRDGALVLLGTVGHAAIQQADGDMLQALRQSVAAPARR